MIPRTVAVPAIDGFGALRGVCVGDVQALVSTVAAADWAPDALATREAVGRRVQRHHEVLGHLLERCTPLPMRMGTILHGNEQVHELLRRAYSTLAETLSAMQGRQEWGIKLTVDRSGLAAQVQRQDPELRALEQRFANTAEGTRYMLAERRDRLRAQLIEGEQARLAQVARSELGRLAEKRAILSARDDCVLNDSLLVEIPRADVLGSRVADLNTRLQGLGTVELTGPWPPYSFAPVIQLGQEAQRVDG